MIEERQGLMISCPEEIAYTSGWITKEELKVQAELMQKNAYGRHLMQVAEGRIMY